MDAQQPNVEDQVAEDQRPSVCLAGYVSSGKSTSVNALAHDHIVDSAMNRSTADVHVTCRNPEAVPWIVAMRKELERLNKLWGLNEPEELNEPEGLNEPKKRKVKLVLHNKPVTTDDGIEIILIDTPGCEDAQMNGREADFNALLKVVAQFCDVILWSSKANRAFNDDPEVKTFQELVAHLDRHTEKTGMLHQVGILLTMFDIFEGIDPAESELMEFAGQVGHRFSQFEIMYFNAFGNIKHHASTSDALKAYAQLRYIESGYGTCTPRHMTFNLAWVLEELQFKREMALLRYLMVTVICKRPALNLREGRMPTEWLMPPHAIAVRLGLSIVNEAALQETVAKISHHDCLTHLLSILMLTDEPGRTEVLFLLRHPSGNDLTDAGSGFASRTRYSDMIWDEACQRLGLQNHLSDVAQEQHGLHNIPNTPQILYRLLHFLGPDDLTVVRMYLMVTRGGARKYLKMHFREARQLTALDPAIHAQMFALDVAYTKQRELGARKSWLARVREARVALWGEEDTDDIETSAIPPLVWNGKTTSVLAPLALDA